VNQKSFCKFAFQKKASFHRESTSGKWEYKDYLAQNRDYTIQKKIGCFTTTNPIH